MFRTCDSVTGDVTTARLRQVKADMLQGGAETGFAKIGQDNPWLASTPLVVKPDQLIKRRGKAGLLAVNKTWPEVQAWISDRMGKSQEVSIFCTYDAPFNVSYSSTWNQHCCDLLATRAAEHVRIGTVFGTNAHKSGDLDFHLQQYYSLYASMRSLPGDPKQLEHRPIAHTPGHIPDLNITRLTAQSY